MNPETTTQPNIPTTPARPAASTVAPVASSAPAAYGQRDAASNMRGGDRGNRTGGRRRERDQKERVKPEFDSKIISIRRVTRVASGGRRFSFSVAVVAGDKKGRVGVGLGKAGDTSLAIDKATRDAKKHMIKVSLNNAMMIAHSVEAKFCSARVEIIPVKGRGIVAGSSLRNIIELAGIKDVSAKVRSGSKNKVNIARAALLALSSITKHSKAFTTEAAAK